MVDREDNFNEFLKQKVEESHFEYNEAYWLKAEKLIEEAQPKRKPFWWGFGFGALSLAIIGGVAGMIYSNNQAQEQSKNGVSSKSANMVYVSSTETMPSKAVNGNMTSTAAVSNIEPQVREQKQSKAMPLADADKKHQQGFSQTKLKSNNASKKQANVKIIESQAISNNQENQIDYSKLGNFSQVRNLSVKTLPETSTMFEDDEESTITIAAPIVINARPKVVKDIDLNIVAACENKNTHEWMLNLLAGVSDSRGFEGNTVTSSRIGFGYFGGIRLGYKLDKNWFVGVQPLIYSRGAINTSIQTEKTAYDFGASSDEFIVKNKALLFGEIPVSIGYRIQRHQISVGAGFEYLINVKSDVKEFGTSDYTPNQWGYTDGFNRFGTMAIFNYAFNVYNEFWLTMMVQKGFTDFTKSDYFTTNSKDENFNLRIGVQYQFNNQKKKGK